MAFASRLKNTADRLIDKFGDSFVVTMVRPDVGVYDDTSYTTSPQAPITWDIKMVVLGYSAYEIGRPSPILGGVSGATQNVLATDRKAIAQVHDTYTPRVTDRVILNDGEYSVINVIPTQPGGVPIFYELQLRGNTDGR